MGSGKTLTSIAASQQLALPLQAVVPAPLVENYHKELKKHLGAEPTGTSVQSYEKAVRDQSAPTQGLAVFDEAHRGRNASTGIHKVLQSASAAPARMLLTGTPMYNNVSDLAPLVNAAAGKELLPSDPKEFERQFVETKAVPTGLWAKLRYGLRDGQVKQLKNKQKLVDAVTGYVDVQPPTTEGFPSRTDETIRVPMTPLQHDLYRFHEGTLPRLLRLKVRYGLPLSKTESADLNAFGTALRQTANTPRPYAAEMTDADEAQHTPKIQRAVQELLKARQADAQHRAVIFSNYLDAGLNPYAKALQAAKVPYGLFTGDVPKAQRDALVRDYNEGKTPVLLVSGAGTEGLDLKKTRLMQILDSHFNNSRLRQFEGRGIRYLSHEGLPEDQRNVHIQRFLSTRPAGLLSRLGLTRTPMAIDEYLQRQADEKDQLAAQVRDALQEASDRGPLSKVSYDWGMSLPNIVPPPTKIATPGAIPQPVENRTDGLAPPTSKPIPKTAEYPYRMLLQNHLKTAAQIPPALTEDMFVRQARLNALKSLAKYMAGAGALVGGGALVHHALRGNSPADSET